MTMTAHAYFLPHVQLATKGKACAQRHRKLIIIGGEGEIRNDYDTCRVRGGGR